MARRWPNGYTQLFPVHASLDESLDVGEDSGTPVTLFYDVPFKFTGKRAKVTIDLK